MGSRSHDRELGQASVELGGLLVLVAAIVVAIVSIGLPTHVGRAVECSVRKILQIGGCNSASSPTNPYAEVCETSMTSESDDLSAELFIFKLSDDEQLLVTKYSNGSSTYVITHGATAQAVANLIQLGSLDVGGSAGAMLAGVKEWDFKTPAQAAAFNKQVNAAGGFNQIAHDIVNNIPLVGGLASGFLDWTGILHSTSLPTPTDTYIQGAAVVNLVGDLPGAGDGLTASAQVGAQVTTSGPDKGQVEAYEQLSATGSETLLSDLGLGPVSGGVGAIGQVLATVTFSKSGKPLSVTITAYGGATSNASAGGDLGPVEVSSSTGAGAGVQWSGTINLQQHPGDLANLALALSGQPTAIAQALTDFNNDGTQTFQPYALTQSQWSAGGDGEIADVGGGLSASDLEYTQNYAPGKIKPPGLSWGTPACAT